MSEQGPPPAGDGWYREMVEAARGFVILSLDADGRVVTWNSGAETTFGFGADEVVGQPGTVIFTPEDNVSGEAAREITIAASQGQALDERWHVRRDGTRFWGSGLLMSMRDPAGIVRGFVKVVQDRSDERRVEENLRRSEEQFARVFMGNPAAIVLERRDTGVFVLANERFFDLTGYWRAEAMGRSGEGLGIWADPGQREAAMALLDSTGRCDGVRIDLKMKGGAVVPCVAAITAATIETAAVNIITLIPRD